MLLPSYQVASGTLFFISKLENETTMEHFMVLVIAWMWP